MRPDLARATAIRNRRLTMDGPGFHVEPDVLDAASRGMADIVHAQDAAELDDLPIAAEVVGDPDLHGAVTARLAPETAHALSDQLATATAFSGDVATILDIDVLDRASPASIEDGPLPVRALLTSGDGEIMVWVADGRLTGLEFAWVTDEPPEAWPSPDELSFHRVSGP